MDSRCHSRRGSVKANGVDVMVCFDYDFPPTPQEIKNDSVSPRDIFAETIGVLVMPPSPVTIQLQAQAWNRFRNRCIGDVDIDYFIQCLADRVNDAWIWYSQIVSILSESDITALYDSESTVTTSSDSTASSEGESSEESPPSTPVDGRSYLTGKSNSSSEQTGSSDGSSISKNSSGMKIERFNKLAEEMRKANARFINELEPLFMNRL